MTDFDRLQALGFDAEVADYLIGAAEGSGTSDLQTLVESFAPLDLTAEQQAQALELLSSRASGMEAHDEPAVLAAPVEAGATHARDEAVVRIMAASTDNRMSAMNSSLDKSATGPVPAADTAAATTRRRRNKGERRRRLHNRMEQTTSKKEYSAAETAGSTASCAESSASSASGSEGELAGDAKVEARIFDTSAGGHVVNMATGEIEGEVTVHVDPDEVVELDPLHVFAAAGSAWRGRAPDGSRKDIVYHCLNMSTDTEDMLVEANLRLRHGRRYGLVGRNGVGKSTLLRHIASRRLPFFPKYLTTVLVQQEAHSSDDTALEAVVTVDKRRAELLKEEARLLADLDTAEHAEEASRLAEALSEVTDLLEQTDAAAARTRAAQLLCSLGFDDAKMNRPLHELSGGWRMRVSLAQALFLKPDVLLLDEPETHLSMDAVLWLQEFLAKITDMTIVIVSHNRAFLDATIEEVIYFHSSNKNLEYWPGNYSAYRHARTEWKRKRQHMFDSQEMKRQHLKTSIDNIKAQAQRAGNNRMKAGGIRSRKIAIEKKLGAYRLENGKKFKFGLYGERSRNAVKLEKPEPPIAFNFPSGGPVGGGGPLLALEGVSFRYPTAGTAAASEASDGVAATATAARRATPSVEGIQRAPFELRDISLTVAPRARIAILGANGEGKSTVLKLLKGELTPQSGKRMARPAVRVAHFAQYHVDMLELDETALEFFRRTKTKPDGTTPSDLEIRTHLGLFSVSGDQPLRPMNTLSGGQRSRVCFAAMMFEAPHVFLVDEGSHHLDVSTLDALGQALRRFDGAVVLVSHDIYLVRDVCERGYPDDDTAGRVISTAASGSGVTTADLLSAAAADMEQDTVPDNIGASAELLVVEGGCMHKVGGLDEYLASIKPEM